MVEVDGMLMKSWVSGAYGEKRVMSGGVTGCRRSGSKTGDCGSEECFGKHVDSSTFSEASEVIMVSELVLHHLMMGVVI